MADPISSVNNAKVNIFFLNAGGCLGRDSIVVGLTTICAISVYHQ
jgi:hypothetical protein